MKNKLLLSAVLLLLSSASFGQLIFGISPGFSFNGGYIGYKINKNVVIYGGLQFASVSFKFDEKGKEFDSFDNLVDYHNKSEFKGGIFVPNIGVKHYFKPTNKLRPYTTLNLAKPILKAKLESGDENLDKEVEDAVKNIKIWAGELGFGTEYFFDENFSIGGEFGIRHLNINVENTRTRTLNDPNTGDPVDVKINTEAKTRLNPTYSRLSLNFYF